MTSYIRPGMLLTYVANPILCRLGSFPALIVRGRRSGEMLTVPMGEPLQFDHGAYLVSGRGETHWVRNLRAAGHGVFRLHGTSTAFRAVEVTGAERDVVVDAYRSKLGHRVDAYFEAIPETARHPAFRMEPCLARPSQGEETRASADHVDSRVATTSHPSARPR